MDSRVRVFYAPHEYQKYLQVCDRETRLTVRIMGESSPRRGITCELTPRDFFIPDAPDVDLAFVKLRETKDSSEGENVLGGQYRISWVPWSLYELIQQYCEDERISEDEEIISVDGARLNGRIKEYAEIAAERYGDPDYLYTTSHDFRAYYATNMVRRLNVPKDTVKEMGGWGSDAAIEPYLAEPLPRDLQDQLTRAGAPEITVPAPVANDKYDLVFERLNRLERALALDDVVNEVTQLTTSDIHALERAAEKIRDTPDINPEATSTLSDYVD